MPQLEPLQLSKLSGAGIISPNAIRTAQVGSGMVQAPRAAEPLQMPYVPRHVQLGAALGADVANVAAAIQNEALRKAAQEAKIQGTNAAMQLYEAMSGEYYGSDIGTMGVSGLVGDEFLQASRQWELKYRQEQGKIAQALGGQAAAEFVAESFKLRESLLDNVRVDQSKQYEVRDKQNKAALNSANAFSLGLKYTTKPAEFGVGINAEVYRRLEADGHAYSLKELENGQFEQQYDPAIVQQYQDQTILDVASNLASDPKNAEVLLQYVSNLESLVKDSTIKKALLSLPGEALDEQTKELERQINLAKAKNEEAIRTNWKHIINTFNQIKDPAAREWYVKDQIEKNPEAYNMLKSVLNIEGRKMQGRDYQFLAEALIGNKEPLKAVNDASALGIVLDEGALNQLVNNWKNKANSDLALYTEKVEVAFEALLQEVTGSDNFGARMLASMFGQVKQNAFLTTMKIRWKEAANKAIDAQQPLDEAYEKFINTQMRPGVMGFSELKPSLNNSTLPVRSSLLQMPRAKADQDLMFKGYGEFATTIISTAPIEVSELMIPVTVGDQTKPIPADEYLYRITDKIEAEIDPNAIQYDSTYQTLAEKFWTVYSYIQEEALKTSRFPPQSDWQESVLLEAWHAKDKLESYYVTRDGNVLEEANAEGTKDAQAAGAVVGALQTVIDTVRGQGKTNE